MNRCLICDKNIEETFYSLLCEEEKLCYECIEKFSVRYKKFKLEGIGGCILYHYNDFFRELIYRYKGLGDYVLKDAFLNNYVDVIKWKYRKYALILAPSSELIEEKRGFSHLEEIFKCLKLPIIKCFKKEGEWKQSDKKLNERKGIQNIIKIDKGLLKGVKKVLIVDDILTSGSTIKAMISQIPSNITKKILVLASNCRIVGDEIV